MVCPFLYLRARRTKQVSNCRREANDCYDRYYHLKSHENYCNYIYDEIDTQPESNILEFEIFGQGKD
jgi:hypothetical protein